MINCGNGIVDFVFDFFLLHFILFTHGLFVGEKDVKIPIIKIKQKNRNELAAMRRRKYFYSIRHSNQMLNFEYFEEKCMEATKKYIGANGKVNVEKSAPFIKDAVA